LDNQAAEAKGAAMDHDVVWGLVNKAHHLVVFEYARDNDLLPHVEGIEPELAPSNDNSRFLLGELWNTEMQRRCPGFRRSS
jgi:hypothetical protein